MKIGDKVRLIGIPPDTNDDQQLQTRALFAACLGRVFTIKGIHPVEDYERMFELRVGHVLGKPSYLHSIWVESRYLEQIC